MILKILLKLWPALIPITIYTIFVLVMKIINKRKNKKYIDGEFREVRSEDKNQEKEVKPDPFSFKNNSFVVVIYLSLVLTILSFLSFAIFSK